MHASSVGSETLFDVRNVIAVPVFVPIGNEIAARVPSPRLNVAMVCAYVVSEKPA